MDSSELYFSVKDIIQDRPVDLDNLSLPIIAELTATAMDFIRGSSKTNLTDMKVAVKSGSFSITVAPSPIIAPAVDDFRRIMKSQSLDAIDRIRAKIVVDLQERARKNPGRSYTIADTSDTKRLSSRSITISKSSDFHMPAEDQWVQTETYAYGWVYDMGGKTNPNVHLRLQNGRSIKLDAEVESLAADAVNRLYKNQLVRIKAEQNLRTKELRNESLVSFEKYDPHFDDNEFKALSAKVKSSWADVPDIVAWVEDIRGNNVQAT